MTQDRDAIVLFAHGARDVRWSEPLFRLQAELRRAHPDLAVPVAYLELQSPSLEESLIALAAAGKRRIAVAPVFWARGGHILNDLPVILDAFRRRHPETGVQVLPVLSELPGMTSFLAQAIAGIDADCQPCDIPQSLPPSP